MAAFSVLIAIRGLAESLTNQMIDGLTAAHTMKSILLASHSHFKRSSCRGKIIQ